MENQEFDHFRRAQAPWIRALNICPGSVHSGQQVLAHGQTAASQCASQPASQPINQPAFNGGLGTFQGFGPRVELGSVQQQRPGNAHYAANSSLESSTSQPSSQPSSQPASQSTGQEVSVHWDNINQAYRQARQAAVKVPDRVCPPLVLASLGSVTASSIRPGVPRESPKRVPRWPTTRGS